MTTTHLCPGCGAEMPTEYAQGLCPTCLEKASNGRVPSASPIAPASTVAYAGRAAAAVSPELAAHFPQLEILEPLGRGGMGEVYRARQITLNRVVALKILQQPIRDEAVFADRFAREARTLAQLNHPGIVTIYDFGESDGLYFFLMEYVDGGSLRNLLQRGVLLTSEVRRLVVEICDALQYAHDAGIVHRDIKPENILLDRCGRVKVADFGLAKLLGGEDVDLRLTGTRHVLGTPHYMAPEQVANPKDVDHRADMYALGVVLYEMLTGARPAGRCTPPSVLVGCDPRFDAVVYRALEADPAKRYARMANMKADVLAAALPPAQVPERPDADTVPPSPRVRKGSHGRWLQSFRAHPILSSIGVVVLYVVVLYLALAVLARVASRPEAFTAGPVPSLFIAARDGRINDIKSLVAHGHEVNARDASGATPLIEAAKSGQVAAARELIALHADVNLADRLGYTALMWAAFLGHDGALQELLKASARVDVKNAKGATALMLAADKGHASAAQALLNAGAAVDARDGDMATALLWAATHGHTDMAKLLLDHQASIDPPESYGRTPLLAAAFHGHDQLAQLLIDRGADANYDHHSHWTPGLALGCHAAFLKQYERAIPLLKQGLEGRGGQRRLKQWSNRQFDQPWPITAGQAQYEIPYPAAALWVLLGECYRETKKWDEAKRAFMSALAAFPRDGDRVLLYQKEPLLVPALKSPPDGDGFVVYPRQTRPTPWTHETYEISRSQTEQLAQNPQGAVTLSFTGESRTPTGTTARERDLQANGILH